MKKFIRKPENIAVAVLIILHAVGIWGLNGENADFFRKLTPVNLLISFFILAMFHPGKNKEWYLFSALVFIMGFAAEFIGVNSGIVFGDYSYGDALGFKLYGTPIIIGLNWLILVVATGSIAEQFSANPYVRVLTGTALMTAMDLFIEPVAPDLNFWEWTSGSIPVQNFLAWAVISMIFHGMYQYFPVNRSNKTALPLYIIMFSFFLILNITLH